MTDSGAVIAELRLIRAAIESRNAVLALKNVYTVEEFAAEILCGNRHPNWVRKQCKAKKIKSVARSPWLIPLSEAAQFINPGK